MQGYQDHGHGDGPDTHGGRATGQLLPPLRPGGGWPGTRGGAEVLPLRNHVAPAPRRQCGADGCHVHHQSSVPGGGSGGPSMLLQMSSLPQNQRQPHRPAHSTSGIDTSGIQRS